MCPLLLVQIATHIKSERQLRPLVPILGEAVYIVNFGRRRVLNSTQLNEQCPDQTSVACWSWVPPAAPRGSWPAWRWPPPPPSSPPSSSPCWWPLWQETRGQLRTGWCPVSLPSNCPSTQSACSSWHFVEQSSHNANWPSIRCQVFLITAAVSHHFLALLSVVNHLLCLIIPPFFWMKLMSPDKKASTCRSVFPFDNFQVFNF